MLNGPGRIEAILNAEMEKLYTKMQSQIAKQDEEFFARLPPVKKWLIINERFTTQCIRGILSRASIFA